MKNAPLDRALEKGQQFSAQSTDPAAPRTCQQECEEAVGAVPAEKIKDPRARPGTELFN